MHMQRKSNYWEASDDSDTDAADAANLAEQPESVDEHVSQPQTSQGKEFYIISCIQSV